MNEKVKNALKRIVGWIAFIAASGLLLAVPAFSLRRISGIPEGRHAVCATESAEERNGEIKRIVAHPEYWRFQPVSVSGTLSYSSARETFYLRDGALSLPLDVSDCQGLAALKEGDMLAVAQGTVAVAGGTPFLVVTKLHETVPAWAKTAFDAGFVGILGTIGAAIGGIVWLLGRFLIAIGVMKRKPVPSPEDVNAKNAGGMLLSSIFLPLIWLANPFIGAIIYVRVLIGGWSGLRSKKRTVAIVGVTLCVTGLVVMPFVSVMQFEQRREFLYDRFEGDPSIEPSGKEPLEITRYENDKARFSIHKPKDWTAVEEEKSDFQLIFRGPQDGTLQDETFNPEIGVNFATFAEANIKTDEDVAKIAETLKQLAQGQEGFALVADERRALAGGQFEADVFEFTDTQRGYDRHVLLMFVVKGDMIYMFGAGMPVEKWDRHGPAMNDALRTLRIWEGPFATCLKDTGAVFYGLFDCEPCKEQKKLFTEGIDRLPYVECKDLEGGTLLAACSDKNLESYPSWEFVDGSRLVGQQTLKTLSEKTGCPLPK